MMPTLDEVEVLLQLHGIAYNRHKADADMLLYVFGRLLEYGRLSNPYMLDCFMARLGVVIVEIDGQAVAKDWDSLSTCDTDTYKIWQQLGITVTVADEG